MAKNWIAGAIKHPGALHKQLGVPAGKKIPAKKMAAARAGKEGPLAAKRANLAKTLGSFHDGGVVPQTGSYMLEKGERVIPSSSHPHDEQAELMEQAKKVKGSMKKGCYCGEDGCGHISPDGIVARDGMKRFDF